MTIRYFNTYERPVFLHFLNREAYEAAQSKPDYKNALQLVELRRVAHCSGMAVNISQLLEYSGMNDSVLSEILDLEDGDIITLISSDPTADEFLNSRRQIYEHDRTRYPMYFDDRAMFIGRYRIGQLNTRSTTDVLTRQILDWGDDLLDPVNSAISTNDQRAVADSRELIQQITMQERGRAVTRAMYRADYRGQKLSPIQLAVAGRMISSIYIQQYRKNYEYVSCTGVQDLVYYDNDRWFPYYDYHLMRHLLGLLGYFYLRSDLGDALKGQRIEFYDSEDHRRFVGLFNVVLDCSLYAAAQARDTPRVAQGSVGAMRVQIMNLLSAIRSRVDRPLAGAEDLPTFFGQACEILDHMGRVGSKEEQPFASKWAENMAPPPEHRKLLLVTATDVEDNALARALLAENITETHPRQAGNTVARVYSPVRNLEIFHVRSSAGSGGSGGSMLTTKDAVDSIQPNFLICVGIAFGADKSEQKMCDLLVSDQIWNYEPGKISEKGFQSRGETLPASPLLLSASRNVRLEADRVHFGIIASGDKVVNLAEFRENLREANPRIIGGEMEGSGISAVCQRDKLDWILIKSICDWGEKKDDRFQRRAADSAVAYCMRIVDLLSKLSIDA